MREIECEVEREEGREGGRERGNEIDYHPCGRHIYLLIIP